MDIPIGEYSTRKSVTLPAVPEPNVKLWSASTDLQVGNQTTFILSALNPITSPESVIVQLVVSPPSGISVDETYFVRSGGALYQNTEPIEPGKDSKIVLGIVGNEVGNYSIPAQVYYYYASDERDKVLELDQNLILNVNSEPTSAPNKTILPGFEVMISVLAMIAVVNITALKKK